MPVISAAKRKRQEDHNFQASLSFVAWTKPNTFNGEESLVLILDDNAVVKNLESFCHL